MKKIKHFFVSLLAVVTVFAALALSSPPNAQAQKFITPVSVSRVDLKEIQTLTPEARARDVQSGIGDSEAASGDTGKYTELSKQPTRIWQELIPPPNIERPALRELSPGNYIRTARRGAIKSQNKFVTGFRKNKSSPN